jgi:hypothetical protein
MSKINRNDPCPCGSGKKYKKCCGPKEEQTRKPRIHALPAISSMAPGQTSSSLSLAQRVFKVLSAPSKAPTEAVAAPEASVSKPRGYSSLEELIGVEGAPHEPPPSQGT